MNFVDLYCGAGLGARGAVAAGAKPVLAVDLWQLAADTYKSNFPSAEVVVGDVAKLDPADFELDEPVDLLLASPECTSHSIARGNRPKCEDSRRTALTILPWIDFYLPRWIIIENVARMRLWNGHAKLAKAIRGRGYWLEEMVLNAKDFGVPQSRERLFMLCGRDVRPPSETEIKRGRFAKKIARDVINWESEWPVGPLHKEGRAESTIARAKRGIEALGRKVPFLVVYYGSDGAGGWQSLDAPLRTITTLDRFGLVTWKNSRPMLRMLQPVELLAAMGARGHRLPHGSRRDRVRICGNGICSPVITTIMKRMIAKNRSTLGCLSAAKAIGPEIYV